MVLTDIGSEVLSNLRHNVSEREEQVRGKTVTVLECKHEEVGMRDMGASRWEDVDLVLGSDLVYSSGCIPGVIKALVRCLRMPSASSRAAVLVNPDRRRGVMNGAFNEALHRAGLHFSVRRIGPGSKAQSPLMDFPGGAKAAKESSCEESSAKDGEASMAANEKDKSMAVRDAEVSLPLERNEACPLAAGGDKAQAAGNEGASLAGLDKRLQEGWDARLLEGLHAMFGLDEDETFSVYFINASAQEDVAVTDGGGATADRSAESTVDGSGHAKRRKISDAEHRVAGL